MKSTYNYHCYNSTGQVILPVNIDVSISKDDPLFTFNEVMEGAQIQQYIKPNSRLGRKGYNSLSLLKIVLFAFMNDIRTTRKIAHACTTDIRFMWLANYYQPTHMTISNFIKNELTYSIQDILVEVNNYLTIADNINTNVIYIDGTKIEANANKYTFVWKKATLKFQGKLFTKISNEINLLNQTLIKYRNVFFQEFEHYTDSDLSDILITIKEIIKENNITLVYGRGKRKTDIQRHYDNFTNYYRKLGEYVTKIEICGPDRNSYSKTDVDATFMRMKDDHMQNGQLKAGYNIQIGVSDEYIMHADVFQDRADFNTFEKFMDGYKQQYGFMPQYPVGDAGYGSYDNYSFCKENNLELFLKYTMYSKEKESSFKKKIYNKRNFEKSETGNYLCPEGYEFVYCKSTNVKRSKYERTNDIYECLNCSNCIHKIECTSAKGNRQITVNDQLDDFERKVRNNLGSELGIKLRVNRSIQVEGAFGNIKENCGYRRIRRRSTINVKTEVLLICVGYNIKKYHNKKWRSLKTTAIIN